MLKNYLTIALRNIMKQKGYSFINMMSLAIGMAGCIIIFLFVQDEFSYNNFHAKVSRKMAKKAKKAPIISNIQLALIKVSKMSIILISSKIKYRISTQAANPRSIMVFLSKTFRRESFSSLNSILVWLSIYTTLI